MIYCLETEGGAEMDENEQKNSIFQKHVGTKTMIFILVLSLILGTVIGGTAAWLSAQTSPVVNTFTYGDINITLTETETDDDDDNPNTNKYKMIPGQQLTKDPKVIVQKDSEDSWLFVKMEKSDNFDDFLEYDMADGWTKLEGEENVYYRVVLSDSDVQEFTVIRDNIVTVRDNVTKEMLNALDVSQDKKNYPTLTITAYAVQHDSELEAINTAVKAWKLITAPQDVESPEEP